MTCRCHWHEVGIGVGLGVVLTMSTVIRCTRLRYVGLVGLVLHCTCVNFFMFPCDIALHCTVAHLTLCVMGIAHYTRVV